MMQLLIFSGNYRNQAVDLREKWAKFKKKYFIINLLLHLFHPVKIWNAFELSLTRQSRFNLFHPVDLFHNFLENNSDQILPLKYQMKELLRAGKFTFTLQGCQAPAHWEPNLITWTKLRANIIENMFLQIEQRTFLNGPKLDWLQPECCVLN